MWKWILAGGCTITVLAWTGGPVLIEAGVKLTEYSNKIVQYESNENKLVEAINKQKEVYLHDTGDFSAALDKANGEIQKANDAAAKLKIELDAAKIKADKHQALTKEELEKITTLVGCKDIKKGSTNGEECEDPDNDSGQGSGHEGGPKPKGDDK